MVCNKVKEIAVLQLCYPVPLLSVVKCSAAYDNVVWRGVLWYSGVGCSEVDGVWCDVVWCSVLSCATV